MTSTLSNSEKWWLMTKQKQVGKYLRNKQLDLNHKRKFYLNLLRTESWS